MKGRVCLVTGATAGVGQAAALALAGMGATLVLVGRNEALCLSSAARITDETGNPRVGYLLADLSSQGQVRQLAADFRARHDRLDVLINNAGAAFLRRKVSADGIEMTFALNHLAYFLLTNLLLDRLLASAPARIINVASNSHNNQRLDFDDLQSQRGYFVMRVYGRSKLANLYFTYELARRLEGTGVTVNAMHPGFVATNMGRNNGPLARLFMPLVQRGARTPAEGARTAVYLASSPQVEGVTGKYFFDEQAIPSDPAAYDREAAARLWQASAEMTGLG